VIAGFDMLAGCGLIGFSWLGLSRGLSDQILRLVPFWGTILLIVVSQSFWMSWLQPWIDPHYRSTVSLGLAALISYPLFILFVRIVSWYCASNALGKANRIGGGLMGLCQGGVWIFCIGFILWLTPIAKEKIFYQSYIAQAIYPFVQKASTKYLWIALKIQPASWLERLKFYR